MCDGERLLYTAEATRRFWSEVQGYQCDHFDKSDDNEEVERNEKTDDFGFTYVRPLTKVKKILGLLMIYMGAYRAASHVYYYGI